MMKRTLSEPKPGQKLVTLKDIGRHLDLSHATVSRVLNGKPDGLISQATIERVRQVAQEMGYRPNHAARALVTGRTGLLALWLWSEGVPNSYHSMVSHQMHRKAFQASYQLLVDPIDRLSLDLQKSRAFDTVHVDGIVAHEASTAIQTRFGPVRPSIPIVTTGAYDLLDGVDEVRVDLTEAVRYAMSHLAAQGRRRIAYLTDDLQNRTGDPRFIAYLEAMESLDRPGEFISTPGTRRGAREGASAYISENGCPDAIVCHNDDLAIGAYRGLLDMRLRVPDQVALVGCDGIEDGEYLEVPLTTIAQPLDQLSEFAIRFLNERIEDSTRPIQSVVLQAELIIRESTG